VRDLMSSQPVAQDQQPRNGRGELRHMRLTTMAWTPLVLTVRPL
jgi:hypothetical protein